MKQIKISCEKSKYIAPRWKCLICKRKATSESVYMNMDWIDHERNKQGYKLLGLVCDECRNALRKRIEQ